MKKVLKASLLFILVAAMLVLTACGGKTQNSGNGQQENGVVSELGKTEEKKSAVVPAKLAEETDEIGESGDYRYILLEDGTVKIDEYNGSESNLIIPASLDGHQVRAIGAEAFRSNYNINTIEIPEGIIYIGKEAFFDCGHLTKVVIPEGITQIKNGTFNIAMI